MDDAKSKIKALNEKIILKADSEFTSMHLDYAFLLFDNFYNEDGNWREDFLTGFFNEHKIPFIFSTELTDRDSVYSENNFNRYAIPGDGHPTTHYNLLVAEEIKKYVLDYQNYSAKKMIVNKSLSDTTSVAYFERKIRMDTRILKSVKQNAAEKNI